MELLRFVDGALHSFRSFREDDFRSESREKFSALNAHGFRHGQDQFVSLDRRRHSEPDSRIAAGWFDDESAFFEPAGFFRIFDQGESDAVLDTGHRIE